jgi:hypothetical protein
MEAQRAELLAELFNKAPGIERALGAAAGPCLKFQGIHPSGKKCKKGNKCPLLHVAVGQELALAQNRLRSPFWQMTRDNRLRLLPPLKQAIKQWWAQALQQTSPCPVTEIDVVRHDDTHMLLLTLEKPLPSSAAQDCVGKSEMACGIDGTRINSSSAAIPEDRTWWHGTDLASFGGILRDSLQARLAGSHKAIYSFTRWETCAAYGGNVYFGFRSFGMVTRLTSKVPEEIPEGLIGYFDSNKKRQWLHHPANVQLTYARVEYDTFCTFLSEALATFQDKQPEGVHQALLNVAGLVVPTYDDKHNFVFEGKQDDDDDLSAAPAFVTASDSSSVAGAHASGVASASGELSASAPSSAIELVHSSQAVVCSTNSSTLPPRPNSRHV